MYVCVCVCVCVFEGECKLSVGGDLSTSMRVAGFIYNYNLIYIRLMHIYILIWGDLFHVARQTYNFACRYMHSVGSFFG